jgi:hypothetical protein
MIHRSIFVLILFFSVPAHALDFNAYHTQDQINQYLRDLAQRYPTLVQFHNLGTSDENREINYITHHGNEWSSTEGILGLVDYLITNKSEATVAALLNQYVFYLQPLVNPDGHFHQTREDINGNDPNRDYAYPGSGTQFKTKIIPLVKSLLDSHVFRAAAAYHSGIEEILWPWCYTASASKDKDLFHTFAKKVAVAMGYDRYLQSYDDYATEGEFIDYAYMSQGTFGLTYEVSADFTPAESDLPGVVSRSIDGAMAFIKSVSDYDRGQLSIEPEATVSLAHSKNPMWTLFGQKLE